MAWGFSLERAKPWEFRNHFPETMKLNQHVGAKTGTQHNHNFVLHTSFLHLPCLPDTNTLLRFPPENEGPEVQTLPPSPCSLSEPPALNPGCLDVREPIQAHGLPSARKACSFKQGHLEKAIRLHPNEFNHRNVKCQRLKWGPIRGARGAP